MNNNQKATKRALLTSVMALVMCVVMLVGTTFAWFTDTASTAVNKIVAGNLNVDIVDENNNSLNGIPFVPQKFRNFPAILEHRKIQANPL